MADASDGLAPPGGPSRVTAPNPANRFYPLPMDDATPGLTQPLLRTLPGARSGVMVPLQDGSEMDLFEVLDLLIEQIEEARQSRQALLDIRARLALMLPDWDKLLEEVANSTVPTRSPWQAHPLQGVLRRSPRHKTLENSELAVRMILYSSGRAELTHLLANCQYAAVNKDWHGALHTVTRPIVLEREKASYILGVT